MASKAQILCPLIIAFPLPGEAQIAVTEYEHGQLEIYDTPTDGPPPGLDAARTEDFSTWRGCRVHV